MFRMFSNNLMLKKIQDTHAPDGREIDVKTLFRLVEDILSNATLHANKTTGNHGDLRDQDNNAVSPDMLDSLSVTIDRISKEIDNDNVESEDDDHSTTVSVMRSVAHYSWDAKLVLVLAAFALKYGAFWLLAQMYSSNKLAEAMSVLKQIPIIMDLEGPLKPRLRALQNLVNEMVKVTRSVIEFKELPSTHISEGTPAFSATMEAIIASVYWTTRSLLRCMDQISRLARIALYYDELRSVTSVPRDKSANDIWYEISIEEERMLSPFIDILSSKTQLLEKRRNEEVYQMLHDLFNGKLSHIDNVKSLKTLIYANDDVQPLIDGSTKKKVNVDVLRSKNVLLLISDLDISPHELAVLEHVYNESRHQTTRVESRYEMVWIPVVDDLVLDVVSVQNQFESLQATMPWYTVSHPSLIEKAFIRFLKQDLHFSSKAFLIVLDYRGRILCRNAIHMVWIWGSKAFPFTRTREETLWMEEKWRLEFLVNDIDSTILSWIKEQKFIFLYGGENVEWIRKFTTAAKAVARAASLPLEMMYIGNSRSRDEFVRIVATISAEKLSHSWQDFSTISFFWTRVENMLLSKVQLGKANELDSLTQEIKELLSHEKGGWTMFSKGSNILINGNGNTVLNALLEYESWKEHVPIKGFELAFRDHHDKLQVDPYPCCRLEFPEAVLRISDGVNCPHCRLPMGMFTTFRCCHTKRIPKEKGTANLPW